MHEQSKSQRTGISGWLRTYLTVQIIPGYLMMGFGAMGLFKALSLGNGTLVSVFVSSIIIGACLYYVPTKGILGQKAFAIKAAMAFHIIMNILAVCGIFSSSAIDIEGPRYLMLSSSFIALSLNSISLLYILPSKRVTYTFGYNESNKWYSLANLTERITKDANFEKAGIEESVRVSNLAE